LACPVDGFFHLILICLYFRFPKEAAEVFGDQDYSAVIPIGAMGLLGIATVLGREGFFEIAVVGLDLASCWINFKNHWNFQVQG
jgi:hypothetical protein